MGSSITPGIASGIVSGMTITTARRLARSKGVALRKLRGADLYDVVHAATGFTVARGVDLRTVAQVLGR